MSCFGRFKRLVLAKETRLLAQDWNDMRVFLAVSRHNTTPAPEVNATEHGANLVVCKWLSVSPEQVDRKLGVFFYAIYRTKAYSAANTRGT